MSKEVKAWVAQIKLREADSGRLDWLEEHGAKVAVQLSGNWVVTTRRGSWFIGATAREAVDAAMKGEGS